MRSPIRAGACAIIILTLTEIKCPGVTLMPTAKFARLLWPDRPWRDFFAATFDRRVGMELVLAKKIPTSEDKAAANELSLAPL
jgi:hypothetical protein